MTPRAASPERHLSRWIGIALAIGASACEREYQECPAEPLRTEAVWRVTESLRNTAGEAPLEVGATLTFLDLAPHRNWLVVEHPATDDGASVEERRDYYLDTGG